MTGGNGARFAAMPLSGGGTPVREWLIPETLPALDLSECPGLIVVAPHPDDETLGLGAMTAQLAASGVDVAVVSVSDGGAAEPDAPSSQRTRLESLRRSELRKATGVLGIRAPVSLGLPDGRLADHEDALTDLLVEMLDEPGACVPPPGAGTGIPTTRPSDARLPRRAHAPGPRCWSIRCGCGIGPARPTRRYRGTARTRYPCPHGHGIANTMPRNAFAASLRQVRKA